MPASRRAMFPMLLSLHLALATPASAADDPASPPDSGASPQRFDQIVYKGVVGNVLDAIPMDPSKRLDLQRTNAVVGNTWLGRSLSVLVGLSNPVLLLGGFVWGVWAASNIKQEDVGMKLAAEPHRAGGDPGSQQPLAVSSVLSSAADQADMNVPEPILVSSISFREPDAAALSPPQVVKIWPTQRPPIPPQ